MDNNIILGGMAAVPIITALLQAVKGWVPSKSLPFCAILIGTVWNVGLTVGTDEFTRSTIFLGIVIGLAASGLYSASRTTAEGVADRINWPGD